MKFHAAPNNLAGVLCEDWCRFRDAGLNTDPHFEEEFCSGSDTRLNQRYWEIALGNMLLDRGLRVVPKANGAGPDFRISYGGTTIWIEATAPERGQGPSAVLDWEEVIWQQKALTSGDKAEIEVPHPSNDDAFLLRYTSALEEKRKAFERYRAEGIVQSEDVLVIALNSSNLGAPSLHGGVEFDKALRAVLPIGAQAITFSRDPSVPVRLGRHVQGSVKKQTTRGVVPVAKAAFLQLEYASISCVIVSEACPTVRSSDKRQTCIVHNHRAAHPLPINVLPGDVEFTIELDERALDVTEYDRAGGRIFRVYVGYRASDKEELHGQ